MSDAIQHGWRRTNLGALAKRLVNGGTPPTDEVRFWQGKLPWITGADFTDSGIGEIRRFVSEDAINQTATNLIERGQLLIVTRTGVGKLAIAPTDIAISQDITGFYIDREQATPEFLYHRLKLGLEDLKKLNQGTSINGITRRDLVSYPLDLPSLPQQRRIATILSTLDEVIEATEKLVEKQQQIKAGLMHDLFTRGLWTQAELACGDHKGLPCAATAKVGQLRPTPEEAPGLYKETSFGLIPKTWEMKKCTELCETITVGIVVRPTQYYVTEGVPALRSANIRETGIEMSDLVFITELSNAFLFKSKIKQGDVLSVRTGYPGTSAVVPPELDGCNCIDILLSRPTELIQSQFLSNWVNSSFGRGQVLSKQGGLAQQHFNVGELRNLLVVVPSADEQTEITARLSSVSDRIAAEETHIAKLRQQKQGLMHDLLTGRVRVE
jgi:type I restriction enzyme S subunit